MSDVEYPTRCRIIDADGQAFAPGVVCRTPEVSRPHIGKEGLAEQQEGEWGVRITLDDGNIIYGHECWWVPLSDPVDKLTQTLQSLPVSDGEWERIKKEPYG